MTYDYEVGLIKITYGKNAMGDPIEIKEERMILADKLDYRNKDFYQAMANGLKPSLTFAVNKYEYEGEESLVYEGEYYKIIDVTPVKSQRWQNESEFESIALMCEGLVNK